MLASPAKRRKTSPTTSVTVDASNSRSNPSTPKRASFQSPTKASLARSHPSLLPQSATQSHVQTRGQGLRQSLLSRGTPQSVSRPSTTVPQTPKQQTEPARSNPADPVTIGAESFSGTIRTLFTAEPSRPPTSARTPLRVRQPPTSLVETQNINHSIQLSKLTQPRAQRSRFTSKNAESDEPDLPPTPVQLGLNAKPDRPRGLASSSPGRSSGSSRRRTRINESRSTSSPSKLRGQAAQIEKSAPERGATTIIAIAAEAPDEAPGEAPESDIEAPAEDGEHSVPDKIFQKRSLRDSLSAQLARLQSDLDSLENILGDSENNNTTFADTDPSLLALLTTTNPSCTDATPDQDEIDYPSPTVPKPTALGSRPLPYLTLFAPGNLQLHSTTGTSVVDGKPHQIHVLELLAPEPWPAHAFGATIRVTADVREKQIKTVELVKMRPGIGHQGLRDWVKRRLEGERSLHRYDVGGLVWGVGRWWEECVARAKIWRRLQESFNNTSSKKIKDSPEDSAVVGEEDVKLLLPHLARTSMEFEPGATKRVTRSSKAVVVETPEIMKVMLLWDLILDWTGEVDETVGVAVAGMGGSGEQGVKDVFGKIFKRDGVFTAMEGIWGTLANGTVSHA